MLYQTDTKTIVSPGDRTNYNFYIGGIDFYKRFDTMIIKKLDNEN